MPALIHGESAAVLLRCLARLDPDHTWLRVSVQGLHRFYGRASADVVASWMTFDGGHEWGDLFVTAAAR